MKLLTTFIAVCVLIVALCAWHIGRELWSATKPPDTPPAADVEIIQAVPPRPDVPSRLAEDRTETRPSVAVASPAPAEARPTEPIADRVPSPVSPGTEPAAATQPAAQTVVHWAGQARQRAAEASLAAAAEVLRDDPYHPAALRDAVEALRVLDRDEEAAILLERLVAVEPGDVELRAEHAAVLVRAQQWSDAIDALVALTRMQPDRVEAWHNLAVARQALGQLQAAWQAWNRVIELQPAADAYARRGEVLLDLSQWEAAAADFERVIAEAPEDDGASLNLALALAELGRDEDARAHLLGVVERRPCHVLALNRLADIEWRRYVAGGGRDLRPAESALSWWRRSLECDDTQEDVRARLSDAEQALRRRT